MALFLNYSSIPVILSHNIFMKFPILIEEGIRNLELQVEFMGNFKLSSWETSDSSLSSVKIFSLI